MRLTHFFLLTLLVAACTCAPAPDKKPTEPFYLKATNFSQLPGWQADSVAAALPALEKSCARIAKKDAAKTFGPTYIGVYADWQAACATLPQNADDAAARSWFEATFTPYEIWDEDRDGLFTGYYEPLLNGASEKSDKYNIPLYARPDDLITVNLGDFRESLKGETVMGRVTGEKLVPYYTRREIEGGKIDGTEKIIWVDNAVDAFFLHIQGSGQVRMEDGTVLRVGYAAANGRAYTAIGKSMLDKGYLQKGDVSMQSIRKWLAENPDKAADVMNINESYVFFRKLDGDGPLGAEGVALTPGRSLAVDRKKLPYGAPVYIDAAPPEAGDAPMQRLMIAQDTGGAIRGAVRGDVFWGAGDVAAHKAGLMKSAGQDYLLLPKNIIVPDALKYDASRMHKVMRGEYAYNE